MFFAKKSLYRGLMLSRIEPKIKIIFVKYIYIFEEAFKTKVFDKLSI